MKSLDARTTELIKLINSSKNIVFFTGAGVSTDSGIPDFRSKNGLYKRKDAQFEGCSPEYLLSASCLKFDTEIFYKFFRQMMDFRYCEPNIVHRTIAELERKGKNVTVVTQNVDGLHRKAGSTDVCEIHGTALRNYCVNCFQEFDGDYIFSSNEAIPTCPTCGGKVRPDVTLYEEALPGSAWSRAQAKTARADLVIVCGTSLKVYPAASLLMFARRSRLVIINRDETDMDHTAALVFHEELKDVFEMVASNFGRAKRG